MSDGALDYDTRDGFNALRANQSAAEVFDYQVAGTLYPHRKAVLEVTGRNDRPIPLGFTSGLGYVSEGEDLLLSVPFVFDVDGRRAIVTFVRDTDEDGLFDFENDTILGFDNTNDDGYTLRLPAGSWEDQPRGYFAVASDDDGETGGPAYFFAHNTFYEDHPNPVPAALPTEQPTSHLQNGDFDSLPGPVVPENAVRYWGWDLPVFGRPGDLIGGSGNYAHLNPHDTISQSIDVLASHFYEVKLNAIALAALDHDGRARIRVAVADRHAEVGAPLLAEKEFEVGYEWQELNLMVPIPRLAAAQLVIENLDAAVAVGVDDILVAASSALPTVRFDRSHVDLVEGDGGELVNLVWNLNGAQAPPYPMFVPVAYYFGSEKGKASQVDFAEHPDADYSWSNGDSLIVSIPLSAVADGEAEGAETAVFELYEPDGAILGDPRVLNVRILDEAENVDPITVSLPSDLIEISEPLSGQSGSTVDKTPQVVRVPVAFSGEPKGTVTVTYELRLGSVGGQQPFAEFSDFGKDLTNIPTLGRGTGTYASSVYNSAPGVHNPGGNVYIGTATIKPRSEQGNDSRSAYIVLEIAHDTLLEDDASQKRFEYAYVRLSSVSSNSTSDNLTFSNGDTTEVKILDNDEPLTLKLSGPAMIAENSANPGEYKITIENGKKAPAGGLTGALTIANGHSSGDLSMPPASCGEDYVPTWPSQPIPCGVDPMTISFTIPEGQHEVVLEIEMVPDEEIPFDDTVDEYFHVELQPGAFDYYQVAPSQNVVDTKILDSNDDNDIVLSIYPHQPSVDESDQRAGFIVSIDEPASQEIFGYFVVYDGAIVDYKGDDPQPEDYDEETARLPGALCDEDYGNYHPEWLLPEATFVCAPPEAVNYRRVGFRIPEGEMLAQNRYDDAIHTPVDDETYTVFVSITDDTIGEATEYFHARLATPDPIQGKTFIVAPETAQIAITDSDLSVFVEADITIAEPANVAEGKTDFVFVRLTRDLQPNEGPITVSVETRDGTGSRAAIAANGDYVPIHSTTPHTVTFQYNTAPSTTVPIPNGVTIPSTGSQYSIAIPITVLGDNIVEYPDEEFTFNLLQSTGATIDTRRDDVVITITDPSGQPIVEFVDDDSTCSCACPVCAAGEQIDLRTGTITHAIATAGAAGLKYVGQTILSAYGTRSVGLAFPSSTSNPNAVPTDLTATISVQEYGLNGSTLAESTVELDPSEYASGASNVFRMQVDQRHLPSGLYENLVTVNAKFDGQDFTTTHSEPFVIIDRIEESLIAPGWSFDFLYHVYDEGQRLAVVRGDDVVGIYEASGLRYRRPQGQFSEFRFEKLGGTYLPFLVHKDGSKEKFDNISYRHVAHIDSFGNVTEYEYDEAGRLHRIKDPLGRFVATYAYTDGLLTSVTDMYGRETTLSFAGDVLTVTYPDPDANVVDDQPIEHFEYYNDPNQPDYRLLKEYRDAEGNATVYTYDSYGFLEQVSRPDGSSWMVTPWLAVGLAPVGGRQKSYPRTTDFSYLRQADDGVDRLAAIFTDARGFVTRHVLDDFGLPLAIKDAAGRVQEYIRNDAGLVTKYIEPGMTLASVSLFTEFAWDDKGNLTDMWHPARYYGDEPEQGRYENLPPLPANLENRPHERWTYDPKFSRVTRYEDALGRVMDYDINGANGSVTAVRYYTGNIPPNAAMSAWQNPLIPADVDANSVVTPHDPISVINELGGGVFSNPATGELPALRPDGAPYVDVNGDLFAGPIDAMLSINELGATLIEYKFEYESVTLNANVMRGLLSSVTDPLQRKTKYAYHTNPAESHDIGKIRSVTQNAQDPVIETVTQYRYDDFGNLEETTDRFGRISAYDYDALDRLVRYAPPDPDPGISNDQFSYRYLYDRRGLLKAESLEQDIVPHSITTEYLYDGVGRVTQVTEAANSSVAGTTSFHYDRNGNLMMMEDPNHRKTMYLYDSLNRVRMIVEDEPDLNTPLPKYWRNPVLAKDVNGDGMIDSRDRDAIGLEFTSSSNGLPRSFADVDGNGQINSNDEIAWDGAPPTFAGGRPVSNYEYYPTGDLHRVTDAENRVTVFKYDESHRLIETIGESVAVYDSQTSQSPVNSLYYDDDGQITATMDALGRISRYQYDYLGQLIVESHPAGNDGVVRTMTYGYDDVGNLVTFNDPKGNVTNYKYDHLDRVSSVTLPAGNHTYGHPVPVTTYTYNDSYRSGERSVTATDPLQRATTYEYDRLDRLTKVVYPKPYEGTDPSSGNSANESPFVKYMYYPSGLVQSLIDGNDHETTYTYDDRFRLTMIEEPWVGTVTPNRPPTHYSYDDAGNLIGLTAPNDVDETIWRYDGLNRVREEEVTILTSGVPGPVKRFYNYDKVGNLVGYVDRNGRETEYVYDALHRLDKEIWHGVGPNPTTINTIEYDYDVAGQLRHTSDAYHDYTYQYDNAGRVAERSVSYLNPGNGQEELQVSFSQDYDPNSNRKWVEALLNDASNPSQLPDYRIDYTYDSLDRVTSILHGTLLVGAGPGGISLPSMLHVRLTYDAASQLREVHRSESLIPGGIEPRESDIKSVYSYDRVGRLEELSHYGRTSSNPVATATLSQFQFGYDTENQLKMFISLQHPSESIEEYEYDARGQLTGIDFVQGSTPDDTYAYDINGNRIGTESTSTYDVELHDRLMEDEFYHYAYDNEGNLVSRQSKGPNPVTTDYQWDHRNRLIGAVVTGGSPSGTSYTYDAFDQWISRTESSSGETTYYVYDEGQIVLAVDGTSSPEVSNRYLWGPRVDMLLADVRVNSPSDVDVFWALTDHLGTVRDLARNNGGNVDVVLHRAYDEFGNFTTPVSTEGADTLFAFTGRPFDKATELQNNLHRWYDPGTGRWISEDPIGFAAGDANLYRYVGNNVTSLTDPSGLAPPDLPPRETGHSTTGNLEKHSAAEHARKLQQQNAVRRLAQETKNADLIDAFKHIDAAISDCEDARKTAERKMLRNTGKTAELAAEMAEYSKSIEQLKAIEIVVENGEIADVKNLEKLPKPAVEALTKGGRWIIGKKVISVLPYVGVGVGVASYPKKVKAKGFICGTVHAVADEMPIVEWVMLAGADHFIPSTKELEYGLIHPAQTYNEVKEVKNDMEKAHLINPPKDSVFQKFFDYIDTLLYGF